MTKQALFVDGNSIMNRAFYGVRPLKTKNGLFTNAVYGYISILKKHIDAINPDYVGVAFDLKAPTFRHKMYGEYKGKRKPMPEELAMQIPYIRRVTEAMGIQCITQEGYEADDILGTYSRICAGNNVFCTIVTGDRDALQLISQNCNVILVSTGKDIVFDVDFFRETYGFEPVNLIDFKALMGDSSDNIPGVAGVGEKTAKDLIGRYGTIENVYASLENGEIKAKLKEKLEINKETAKLSKTLATICLETPNLPVLSQIDAKDADSETLRELLIELEFTKFLKMFQLDSSASAPSDNGQMSMDFSQENIQETVEIVDISCEEFFEICGDTVFLSYNNGENFLYFYIDGKVYRVKENTEKIITDQKIKIVLYDYKDYCHFCASVFGNDILKKVKNVVFDAHLAAYIINSAQSATDISKLIIQYTGKTIGSRESESAAYNCGYLPQLYNVLYERIEQCDCVELYKNIELPLAKVLAKAEIYGFKVEQNGIKQYGEKLKNEIYMAEQQIYSYAGPFNINSPKQPGVVLFEKLQLPVLKKNKTGYSTDAETLDRLSNRHPIINQILWYRQLTKLHGTYVEGLLKVVDTDGRIHTKFNQTLTATGRLSSSEPNLQNIPIRTELGRELRKYFIAENSDYLLIDADYSQIELRLLAHISDDTRLINAFRDGEDVHIITASQVFGVDIENVTPEMRKSAKAVNFGIVYGISDYSLSIDLGIPKYEASDYIKGYFKTYPKVKEYLDNIKKKAHEDGFVTTIFNRRRQIPELASSKKMVQAFGERVAMNTPIQGSSADIIKLAMVNTDKRLEKEGLKSRLIMQVHDELILESPREEVEYAAKLLREEMENAVHLQNVTLECDVGIGENWFDAH